MQLDIDIKNKKIQKINLSVPLGSYHVLLYGGKPSFVDGNRATIPSDIIIPSERKSNLGLMIRISSPFWHGFCSSVNRMTKINQLKHSYSIKSERFYEIYDVIFLGDYSFYATTMRCLGHVGP